MDVLLQNLSLFHPSRRPTTRRQKDAQFHGTDLELHTLRGYLSTIFDWSHMDLTLLVGSINIETDQLR